MSGENVDVYAMIGNQLEESTPDALRVMLGNLLAAVMGAEAATLCGADYGSRSDERLNQRNGYRERALETRLGTIDLAIPKLRSGSYLPSFIEPRRRWEKAFVNVVAEAYVHGVSTRKVEELVEAMGAKGMSKSQVSRMAAVLDEEVTAFRTRPIERPIPYVWLDATYVKTRDNGRIVSKAVFVAVGVNGDGEREVLGVSIAHKEMASSWRSFIASLVERGLDGVQLVISDAHEGLRQAIPAVINGVTWQRCYVHFIRNVLSHVPKKAQGLIAATLRNVFHQTDAPLARQAMTKVIELLDDKYPNVARLVEEAQHDVLAYFQFPEAHRKQIRSTNPLERLNKELRRRVRVVGIFPNDAAVLRLLGTLLLEQHEEWSVGRKYFSTGSMALLRPAARPQPALEDADAAR